MEKKQKMLSQPRRRNAREKKSGVTIKWVEDTRYCCTAAWAAYSAAKAGITWSQFIDARGMNRIK